MRNTIAIKIIAATALLTLTFSSFAHEGHGLHGPHWHATDAWGFVAMGLLVALAIWLTRGGK